MSSQADIEKMLANLPKPSDIEKMLASMPSQVDIEKAMANMPKPADIEKALASMPSEADINKALANMPKPGDIEKALANMPSQADVERILANMPKPADIDRMLASLVPDRAKAGVLATLGFSTEQVRGLSAAVAETIPDAADALADFEQVIDDGPSVMAEWLRKLAPAMRPQIVVATAAALVAIIEYVETKAGAEPSPETTFLVAALLAVAMLLAVLDGGS